MKREGTVFELKRQQQSNALSAVGIGKDKLKLISFVTQNEKNEEVLGHLVKDILYDAQEFKEQTMKWPIGLREEVLARLQCSPEEVRFVYYNFVQESSCFLHAFRDSPDCKTELVPMCWDGYPVEMKLATYPNLLAVFVSGWKGTNSMSRIFFVK